MLLLSHVSVPKIISGSDVSTRFHSSSFLFFILWKFMFRTFMLLYFLILGCFGFTGDEQCFGEPGLAGVSESFVLSRMEN